MKINKLFSQVFFLLVFSIKLHGQIDLVDITSKSRENYHDLIFNVVDTIYENDFWIITAKGQHKGTTVGIQIRIRNGLKPGLSENGRIDNTSWALEAVEMSTIGEESNNFVKAISELYGLETDEKFTEKPIVFTCFSLNTKPAILENGYYEFKLFFDDTKDKNLYTELFLNLNLPEGYIEIPDKDPRHSGNFVKAMIR